MKAVRYEQRKLAELVLDDENPRTISPSGVSALGRSGATSGWRAPRNTTAVAIA